MTIKSIVIPAVLAVVLAVAGWGFWTLGHTEQRLAEAHKQLAVLQYAEAGNESDDAAAEPPMVQRLIAQGGLSDGDAKDASAARNRRLLAGALCRPRTEARCRRRDHRKRSRRPAVRGQLGLPRRPGRHRSQPRTAPSRRRRQDLRRSAEEQRIARRRGLQLRVRDSRSGHADEGQAVTAAKAGGACRRGKG